MEAGKASRPADGLPPEQHTLRGVEAADILCTCQELSVEKWRFILGRGGTQREVVTFRGRTKSMALWLTSTLGSSPTLSPAFFEVMCEDKLLGPLTPDQELPLDAQALPAWTLSQSLQHWATNTMEGKSHNSWIDMSQEAVGTCNSGHMPHPGLTLQADTGLVVKKYLVILGAQPGSWAGGRGGNGRSGEVGGGKDGGKDGS